MLSPVQSSVGNSALNGAIFFPWTCLLLALALLWVFNKLLSSHKSFIATSCIAIGTLIGFYLQPTVFKKVLAVVTDQMNLGMISYMASTLLTGLVVLYDLSQHPYD